jgi:hypothetical protein
MNKQDLPPSAVVLDLVLTWSDKIGKAGTATISKDGLTFATRNHRGEFVMLSAPVHYDGPAEDGPPPRFVLRRLGPGVWKLAPSVLTAQLHCYLTIVDVPVPAPWEIA